MILRRFGHQAILHDKEGGDGASGDDDNTQSSDTGDTQSQGNGTDGGDPPKTYTQAELDQKLKGQGSALKTMEAKIAAFEAAATKTKDTETKRKQAEMSDLEKLQAKLVDANAATDALKAANVERDTKDAAAKARRMAEALVKPYVYDDDVYGMIPAAGMETGDDGKLTSDALKAVEAFITAKVETGMLKAKPGGTGPAATGPAGSQRTEHKGTNADIMKWAQNRKNRS